MTIRSTFLSWVSLAVVCLAFVVPSGSMVSVVGGEAPNAKSLDIDGNICVSQPGQKCLVDRNVCRLDTPWTKVCVTHGGSEGCADH